LWCPSKHRILLSNDVIFDETHFQWRAVGGHGRESHPSHDSHLRVDDEAKVPFTPLKPITPTDARKVSFVPPDDEHKENDVGSSLPIDSDNDVPIPDEEIWDDELEHKSEPKIRRSSRMKSAPSNLVKDFVAFSVNSDLAPLLNALCADAPLLLV
jgi:hypothetical protein